MGKWYLVPCPQGSPGPSWAPHGSLGAEIQLKPPSGEEESSHPTAHPRMGVYMGGVVTPLVRQSLGPVPPPVRLKVRPEAHPVLWPISTGLSAVLVNQANFASQCLSQRLSAREAINTGFGL